MVITTKGDSTPSEPPDSGKSRLNTAKIAPSTLLQVSNTSSNSVAISAFMVGGAPVVGRDGSGRIAVDHQPEPSPYRMAIGQEITGGLILTSTQTTATLPHILTA